MADLEKYQFIVDTDPGIDDAIALIMAMTEETIDLSLITTVAGNVGIESTTNNALKLVDFFNKKTPVAKGATEPLLKELEDASFFHGETGMDGYDFEEPISAPVSENAVEAMSRTILNSSKKTIVVALGPLTNVALLLKAYPEVKDKIEKIVFMGGGFKTGNTSSVAEFNIYNDPHAAEIVFRSGVPAVMVGFDVTYDALVKKDEVNKVKEMGPVGDMIYSLFSFYRGGSIDEGLRVHDATTLAYLLKPEMFELKHLHVETVLEGPAAGATVRNMLTDDEEPKNLHVCLSVDTEAYDDWFVTQIQKAAKYYAEYVEGSGN